MLCFPPVVNETLTNTVSETLNQYVLGLVLMHKKYFVKFI